MKLGGEYLASVYCSITIHSRVQVWRWTKARGSVHTTLYYIAWTRTGGCQRFGYISPTLGELPAFMAVSQANNEKLRRHRSERYRPAVLNDEH